MPDIPDDELLKKLSYLLRETCAIILPSDVTLRSLPRDLLTCLKTLDAQQEIESGEVPSQFSTDADPETARAIVDRQLSQYGGVGHCYRAK